MIGHYTATALRGFRRRPGTTLIKILALGPGLGCFILAYGAVATMEYGDDAYSHADRIYILTQTVPQVGSPRDAMPLVYSAGPAAKFLKADFPEIDAIARYSTHGKVAVAVGDHVAERMMTAADPNLFSLFGVSLLVGDAATALAAPKSAVLTEAGAKAMFGSTDVLGKTLTLEGKVDVTVTGVVAKAPEFGGVDMIVSMDAADAVMKAEGFRVNSPDAAWYGVGYITYIRLPESGTLTAERLRQGLVSFGVRHMPKQVASRFGLIPLSRFWVNQIDALYLKNSAGLSITTVLYFLGLLVLGVACLDFINLATAEAIMRGREMGMRRVMGATSRHVAAQYLTEVLLLSAVSLILALGFVNVTGRFDELITMPLMRQADTWLFIAGSLGLVILAAGVYPALVLARIRPVGALRQGTGRGRSGPLRAILIGGQFAVASALLVAVIVIQAENHHLRETTLKLVDDPTLYISTGLQQTHIDPEVFRTEIMDGPGIKSMTTAMIPPFSEPATAARYTKSSDPGARTIPINVRSVGFDYFKTTGIRLLAGRTFSRARGDIPPKSSSQKPSSGAKTHWMPRIIIDKATARTFGWTPDQAVGKLLYRKIASSSQAGAKSFITDEIIGVADNTPLEFGTFGSTFYLYTLQPVYTPYPIIRISKTQMPAALAHIDQVWAKLAPDKPIERHFLEEGFDQQFASYKATSDLLTGTAVIAVVVAAMGLIGMAAHMVGRRRREIGVRKTLGARTGQILQLLLWDFSKPVLIANLVACPAAYIASRIYLDTFSSRIGLTALPFLASLAATVAIAWAAVGLHAIRAARLKPSSVLRYE